MHYIACSMKSFLRSLMLSMVILQNLNDAGWREREREQGRVGGRIWDKYKIKRFSKINSRGYNQFNKGNFGVHFGWNSFIAVALETIISNMMTSLQIEQMVLSL